MELWLCTHADPTEPPSITNPSSWIAQEDFSDVYPFTSCVRIDSAAGLRKPFAALLRIAKWLKSLPIELP
jgi:hypothetical protein